MHKAIYQERPPEQRMMFIRDTCDKIEDFTYEKSYTNQDVEVFCDRLSKIMIDLKQMETELARIKKEHTEKIKPLKAEISDLLNSIKFRSKMVKEKVYIFIDYEKNEVGYYSAEGILVHRRQLKIDEHQRSIMSAARTAAFEDEDDDDDDIGDDDSDDVMSRADVVFDDVEILKEQRW